MTLQRLGIIGAGGIAELALASLAKELRAPLQHVAILVPAQFELQARDLLVRCGPALTK